MFEKRISIFTGHFGSGKTEIAVNYSIQMSGLYDKTAIVDLDIVNPYFRTADVKAELENRSIWTIIPMYANTNVDVPALPAEMNTIFEKKEYRVVLDVGGDDLGARALSRYKDEILQDDYEMYCVINTKRIMTDTIDKIEEMIQSIEDSSRLKVTKLVNNTNLLHSTVQQDIMESSDMIRIVSEKLDIPIGFTSGFYGVIHPIRESIGTEVLYLEKLIKLPWDPQTE